MHLIELYASRCEASDEANRAPSGNELGLLVLAVSAQQHNVDTQKSRLTSHIGKAGAFSSLGHEHEVRAPIHGGTADTGSPPAVEMRVDTRALGVIDKDESDKSRTEVQKTKLGPEVLDSELLPGSHKTSRLVGWVVGLEI